jgi:ribulose-phosphate 3-epimerase
MTQISAQIESVLICADLRRSLRGSADHFFEGYPMPAIAPSILAADFARLGEQVRETERAGADRVHVDVMDGHFVPNLSMGSVVVKGLRPVTKLPLEVHLMVERPASFVEGFIKAGADSIIFHLEVEPNPLELIGHVRSLGKKVGLAFNPDFNLAKVEPWLDDIDLALCMTVFPGFGGQAYIPESSGRVRQLRAWVDKLNPACELEVDGGIDARTIGEAAAAGANVFVAGTAVFGAAGGPAAAVQELARLAANR